jgi:sodium/bile acid cotransporter 7
LRLPLPHAPSRDYPLRTQQLGGNVSLALLLTVASNILGIFTMPFVLPHVVAASGISTGPGAAVQGAAASMLEPLPLMLQLCQTILVPTLIGASIRGLIPGGPCIAWA